MEYNDNLIGKDASDMDALDLKIRAEYKKAKGWLPVEVYDMCQCGYPYPNHGEMIHRVDGGTNEKREMIPPAGMWCKAEDVRALLKKHKIIK